MADDIEYYLGEDTDLGPPPRIEPGVGRDGKLPILMLDVDGVLNVRPGSLDQDKLERLRQICLQTRCGVVLSSSWRTVPSQLARLQRVLADRGILLLGCIPDLTYVTGTGGLLAARHRWEEINHWLGSHYGQYDKDKVVILDDQSDMGPLQALLVRTESHVGLTDDIANQIINHFNK